MAAEQVCSFTRLSPSELSDAIKAGRIPKAIRGKFVLREAISGAFAWYRDKIDMPVTVDKDELRNLTGLSDQRHRQLANDGHFPPPVRGRYQLKAVFGGFVRYITKHRDEREKSMDEKRKRELDDKHAMHELEFSERAKSLISVPLMAAKLTPALTAMRQRILASTLTEEERDQLLDDLGQILDDAIKQPISGSGSSHSPNSDASAKADRQQVGG